MVVYKKLLPTRWRDYKELRLAALKKDWLAFGVAYEDEVNYSEEQWKRKLRTALFAIDDDAIVGMIAYQFETLYKMRHIAYISDVFVKEKYRKMGIGSRLMEKAIHKIRKNKKIEKIKLIADPTQAPAINMYKKFGFRKVALIKRELKYKGSYYDDLHMELWL